MLRVGEPLPPDLHLRAGEPAIDNNTVEHANARLRVRRAVEDRVEGPAASDHDPVTDVQLRYLSVGDSNLAQSLSRKNAIAEFATDNPGHHAPGDYPFREGDYDLSIGWLGGEGP